MLILQYHLSYFTPIEAADILRPSNDIEGLILGRQFAKLRRVSHSSTTSHDGKPSEHQHFAEQILSVALMIYKPHGTFRLIALGGNGVSRDFFKSFNYARIDPENRLVIHPDLLGRAAGLAHFLNALSWLIRTWDKGWNDTLDTIQAVVGFQVSWKSIILPPPTCTYLVCLACSDLRQINHTFEENGLESYMFDNSSSMDLSKQYFTVLELLRIARQRIEDDFAEWERLCSPEDRGYSLAGSEPINTFIFSIVDEDLRDETMKSWETQRDRLTESFRAIMDRLKGRIDRQTEDVKSLRDGVRLHHSVSSSLLRFQVAGLHGNVLTIGFTSCSTQHHSEKR